MDKKVFNAYSQYYDLLYKDKDYETETEYVHNIITKYCKQASHVLELGCGTGIHALRLAEKGYQVEGIDLSETMLRMALERQAEAPIAIAQKLSFLEGDARSYVSTIKFDAIISLFHVLSYMTNHDDLHKTFKTVKNHLKPHGVFIFDCWHGPGVLADKPVSRVRTFENETTCIKRTSVPGFFPEKNIVDVNFEIDILDKQTNKHTVLHEIHSMRYLFIEELKNIADINGLEFIHAEEWLTGNTLSEKSWNACYVCKNKN